MFAVYLLAPIMYLQKLVWTFTGLKFSYNYFNLHVQYFPKCIKKAECVYMEQHRRMPVLAFCIHA